MSRWSSLLLAAVLLVVPAAARAQGFVIVANAASPIASVSKDELSQIFLKQTAAVKGAKVQPVDQDKFSPAREAFTKSVHGRTVAAVISYWQAQVFSGNAAPPPVKSTDAEVLAFVRSTPGAIGYVAAGTAPGAGVKTVAVSN